MTAPEAVRRPPETLEGAGLLLERWRSEDVEALHAATEASRAHLEVWTPWVCEGSIDARAAFVERSERHWESGEAFEYAIRTSTGGDVAGGAVLLARIGPDALEIGYWVASGHTRTGLATTAAALLAEAAFALEGIVAVQIHHDEANLASAAIPEKLGFRRIGTFPNPTSAPADTGFDTRWRLDEADFVSPARLLP
ncbi:MAG TPA: GNAT family protein [Solirubrobacteraceae bacterium]|jgi:RimJ/RimL family protein N-acetyltransferase|nr:GNAT family protein [Solirubrobacteraceae bacterium]